MNTHATTKWTWEYSNDTGPDDDYFVEFYEIRNEKHELIGSAEDADDARLIAAAPELLEVLKYVRAVLPQDRWADDAKKMIDAAIAKAEGSNE